MNLCFHFILMILCLGRYRYIPFHQAWYHPQFKSRANQAHSQARVAASRWWWQIHRQPQLLMKGEEEVVNCGPGQDTGTRAAGRNPFCSQETSISPLEAQTSGFAQNTAPLQCRLTCWLLGAGPRPLLMFPWVKLSWLVWALRSTTSLVAALELGSLQLTLQTVPSLATTRSEKAPRSLVKLQGSGVYS